MDQRGATSPGPSPGLRAGRRGAWLHPVAVGLVAGVTLLTGAEARAEFSVCNRTFEIANVAVGWSENSVMRSSGWWTIGPNQCANVIDDRLTSRYVYVFAQDVFGNAMLPGTATICVDTARFNINGERDCLLQGYLEAKFYEVDTYRSERWTLFLNPSPGSSGAPDD